MKGRTRRTKDMRKRHKERKRKKREKLMGGRKGPRQVSSDFMGERTK